MAGSVTDLDGYLRNDEDNLTKQLTSFYNVLKPKEYPSKIGIGIKIVGAASWESLLKDERGQAKSIVVAEKPTDISMIIAEIESELTKRYGPSPTGFHLRTRASKVGCASSPDVDMTRRIVAGESSEVEGSAALWKEMYEHKCAEYTEVNRNYMALMQTGQLMLNSSTILNAEQSKVIGSLATVRAAGVAANEYGGLTTILGMFAMFFLLPHIRSILGLRQDAGIMQIKAAVEGIISGKLPAPEPRRIPAGAAAPAEAKPTASPEDTAPPAPASAVAPDVDQIAELVKNDDGFLASLKAKIFSDPELLARVTS